MLFKRLVEYFGRIESTRARNEKTVILAEILREASHEEVEQLVYLSLGGLRPAFERLEFNMAEKMILRAIGATNEEYQKVGDLGELAVKIKSQGSELGARKPACAGRFGTMGTGSELGVSEVYEELTKIARESGSGSQERKVAGLAKLIRRMDGQSAKYIVRMVAGKLRLGFSDKTVIDALSYLEKGSKEDSKILEQAYQRRPDVGVLARQVREMGVSEAVNNFDVEIGTPIVPALAQRLKTAKEMIEKMGMVYCEKKWDGTRVQIHFSRSGGKGSELGTRKPACAGRFGTMGAGSKLGVQASMFGQEKPKFWVRSFTRNLDESSNQFPELMRIEGQIKADEVILDSEAVGYDPKTGKLVPFQLTITRKRKHGVGEAQSAVPLRFFVFDIMYRDGKSLIHLPLSERRRILEETIQGDKGSELGARKPACAGRFGTMGAGLELGAGTEVLVVDEFIETDDPNVLREYHKKQLAAGLEGVLVKQRDGEYMPGRTGFNWVKFKESEDSRAKLADTLDVVIMGYYLGKGKRQKFGVGAFLVGIRGGKHSRSVGALHSGSDGDEDRILTLAKVGTGITDEVFGELRERLKKIIVKMKETNTPGVWEPFTPGVMGAVTYHVPKSLEPDVWVEPQIIVEVAADEITISPTHSAGYALRFPRLVKFRDDKGVEQITTLEEIETMFGIVEA